MIPSTLRHLWAQCSSQREWVWPYTITQTTHYSYHTQVHVVPADIHDTVCIEYTQWRLRGPRWPFGHVIRGDGGVPGTTEAIGTDA